MVDIDAAGGIDPARLARALELTVRRMERGRYQVSSASAEHFVDLIDPSMERCDCADFAWRQVVCQHLLACLLREGDERVVVAAARLVARLRQENRQLRTVVRGRTIPLTCALKARVAARVRAHPEDLEFRRIPGECSSDVAVHLRATGELLGHLSRNASPPTFVPGSAAGGAAPPRVRIAA